MVKHIRLGLRKLSEEESQTVWITTPHGSPFSRDAPSQTPDVASEEPSALTPEEEKLEEEQDRAHWAHRYSESQKALREGRGRKPESGKDGEPPE